MRKALARDITDISGVLSDAWRADVALGVLCGVLVRRSDLGEVVQALLRRAASVQMLGSLFAGTLRQFF